MCGIAGIVYDDPRRVVDPDVLRRMSDALRHRGPDDEGAWTGPGVGLAHRRLSVIDLSPSGRQPMANEDGDLRLVFNGEIYNFIELRRDLEARGHAFASQTDSETILHLHEELGDGCVERLHGMFAFALWDASQRRLLLARDRVGKKPLKYARIDGGLIFASELKALLASGLVDREVDVAALDDYLTLGYIPAPGTGFVNIEKLPPATTMVWQDGQACTRRYWTWDFRAKQTRSDADWKGAVRETVQAAVQRRLISDVPLGAFLSGGIDSSIVVACMARASSRPVETFSVGFDYESHNELPYARMVAERHATKHHEFMVRPDAAELLPTLARLYEEPYADSSALPSYYLARETRQHVTVALNGDGGDEAFGGYDRYARLLAWAGRTNFARPALHAPARLAQALLGGALPSNLARKLDGLAAMTHARPSQRHAWLMRTFSSREKRALYRGELTRHAARPLDTVLAETMNRPEAGAALLDRLQYTDGMTYLPDDLLVKMDLASMAHGLETRSPLLDHAVLELAARTPAKVRLRGGSLKWLLKEAFRDDLPAPLLDRPKQGFGIPVHHWFRGPLQPLVHDLLLTPNARLATWLRQDVIARWNDEHLRGRVQRGNQLWTLAMLELWLREVARVG